MKQIISTYCGVRKLCLAIVAVTLGSFVSYAEDPVPDHTTVLLFGDSIAAGFGLPIEEGLAYQLEKSLNAAGAQVALVPAGVSGDTSKGGLARLDWSLSEDVDVIVIILGGNDALRAIPPEETRANMSELLRQSHAKGLKVLLTGMRAPPNLGTEYAAEFEPIFADLAEEFDVALYPFILEGVAAMPELNQADGIHPNAAGVEVIVAGLTPHLIKLISDIPETE